MNAEHKYEKGDVLIDVQSLKKSFGDNVVLNGITTQIKKGEVVVVIGPSGSGNPLRSSPSSSGPAARWRAPGTPPR